MRNKPVVLNQQVLEKIKGDFRGYEMGIWYTYYLRAG